MTDESELRRIAERRVDMKLGFRRHLFAYVIVNAGLVAINLITSPGYYWFVWPMLGWGIGLAAHASTVYMSGEGDRDRLVQAELDKLRRERP